MIGGGFDSGYDFRMRMAKDGRPPGADVINQLVAVHVPDVRAFGPVDEERLAADGAERAHGRVHAAGNVFQRLGEKLVGFGPIHGQKLTTKSQRHKEEEFNSGFGRRLYQRPGFSNRISATNCGQPMEHITVSVNIGTVCPVAGKSGCGEGRARHSVCAGMHARCGGQRTARPACPNVSISM